jgi:hypothetical protein
MVAVSTAFALTLDNFAGALSAAAADVALEHGVQGPSVGLELDLWRAVRTVVHAEQARGRLCEDALAAVTVAAYRTALRHGFRGAFVNLELDLWEALERVCQEYRDDARSPSARQTPAAKRAWAQC